MTVSLKFRFFNRGQHKIIEKQFLPIKECVIRVFYIIEIGAIVAAARWRVTNDNQWGGWLPEKRIFNFLIRIKCVTWFLVVASTNRGQSIFAVMHFF